MKKFASILAIVAALFVFDLAVKKDDAPIKEEDKSSQIMSVLDTVDDEFGLFGYSVSHEESIIYIFMDSAKSEKELKEYLSKQIAKKELEQYRYDITKRPLEEVQTETNLAKIEGVLFDYLEGKNYTDIQRVISFSEPEPTIKIDLAKTSERSIEEFEAELNNILASYDTNTPKNFKYRIQIEKTENV
ncbi:hypothetical protein P2R12_15620 [Cytobacillus oceanisediminis]|uniref:hypothetical protein n=1 Tax=Cytobacillus oceanisediminis TaxID=665099 RepID=UPI0023DC774C|nr:hypothetical protein [Cytobacillus oceanisediminis]MDF2038388.1 hypothetical protein [Cytobacillus oceanisediminis]